MVCTRGMGDKLNKLHDLKIQRSSEEDSGERSIRPFLYGGGAVIVLALLAWAAFSFFRTEPEEPVRQAADTAAADNQTGNAEASGTAQAQQPPASQSRQILNASGYITARRMATVSAEITGRVVEILIEEGTTVEQGQVVARLDDTLALVDLALAEAQVESAEAGLLEVAASLAEAERVLARNRTLAEEQFASEAAVTRAEADVEALTAQHARISADLEIARLQVSRQRETVEKHIIRAPFAGVVVDKNAQPGEIISPISAGGGFTRTGICTLVDMDSLEIEVDVNESYIGRVFAGQEVVATLDSYPDWQIPAAVIAVVPTANRDKATVRVRISLGEKDPRILPDMGVKVAFLRDEN